MPSAPRVFISYSHDSDPHKQRVLALASRLRDDGVDVRLDQYEPSPKEGWPRWTRRQIKEAGAVIVVATATYERRFDGEEEKGKGRGVSWEGAIVAQELYDAGTENVTFVPVVLTEDDLPHIPVVLRGFTCYCLSAPDGYDSLYRHLTGQPDVVAPPLGDLKEMPPRGVEPVYADDATRQLSQDLEAAYERRAELASTGEDVAEVNARIVDLRRRLREGGHLRAGDFLADGRWKLCERIGQGGFASVWKAYDAERGEMVAVKVLHGQYAHDRTRRERFFRGARRMAQLRDPGFVGVIEAQCDEGGHHYFVMEYAGGGDLHRAVVDGRVSRDQGLGIVLKVGEALAHAHGKGLIHRDVKPANVLLDLDGTPKLTDFDLVRALDSTGGTRTGMLGTFLYAAPEAMMRAQEAGAPADVYGLGMTALFVLHGEDLPPDVLWETESFIADLDVSDACKRVLARAVARKPDDRWCSVGELCAALRAAIRKETVPPPKRERTHRKTGTQEIRERVHEKDGSVLVYVPGGELMLGADDLGDNEKPVHRVRLSPFWIGKLPVTNEQYGRYLEVHPDRPKPAYWGSERFNAPEQPVVGVSWLEALAYCRWAGLVLPSEAQWEAAARGPEERRYPWGDEEPTATLATFGQPWESGKPTPVGSHPGGMGPYGALDQAGNVWEWCVDKFEATAYRDRDGKSDPVVTAAEDTQDVLRVVRGGSWYDQSRVLRAAFRSGSRSGDRVRFLGFRVLLRSGPEP